VVATIVRGFWSYSRFVAEQITRPPIEFTLEVESGPAVQAKLPSLVAVAQSALPVCTQPYAQVAVEITHKQQYVRGDPEYGGGGWMDFGGRHQGRLRQNH
jgi:hypothetical protein